jgi:hypothetical protein
MILQHQLVVSIKNFELKDMRRLLEAINVLRKETDSSSFQWPSNGPPIIHADSVRGFLMIDATDDMDVDDLQAFVRDNRHLFPENTELLVVGQSTQATTIAINVIESMAPFSRIDILPSLRLTQRWKDIPVDLTDIKTDVPIRWSNDRYVSNPIFDPSKVRDLNIVGPAQLTPSNIYIRLQRLTIDHLEGIIGIQDVNAHLLSLKLKGQMAVAVHSFKEYSSLKVLDLRRGTSPRINKLPEIVLPSSLDTIKLTGFMWGVLICGKVNKRLVLVSSLKGSS